MNHGRLVPPSKLMRVMLCAGCALTVWSASPAIAQELADRCAAPLIAAAEAPDPQSFWDADRQISVYRRQVDGRFVYRIVGDVVELTPGLFPMLSTAPGGSLRNVAEI